MNFLAHAYLSFHHPDVLAGNMISDFVKGRKQYDFSPEIRNGIILHRFIDEWTDQHPVNREIKQIFRPVFGLYSAAILDVIYDHFLANDPLHFSNQDLHHFATQTYEHLELLTPVFPERFARMFPYMKEQNWLYHYHSTEGIRNGLGGLQRRAKYIADIHPAFDLLDQHYETIKSGYSLFFPDLHQLAFVEFQRLTGKENA